jgi:hypothetical protein
VRPAEGGPGPYERSQLLMAHRSIQLHLRALPPETWLRLTRETQGRYYQFCSLARQLRVVPQAVFLGWRIPEEEVDGETWEIHSKP